MRRGEDRIVGNEEVKELRVLCWVDVHMLEVSKKIFTERNAVTFVNLPGCGHAKGKVGKMESDSMHFKGDVVFARTRRRNDLGNINEDIPPGCGMSAMETKAGGLQG